MPQLIHMPHLGTAEKMIRVARWLAAEGAAVRRGEPVVAVETLKATFEIDAESDGRLVKQLAPEGARLPTGAPLAILCSDGEQVDVHAETLRLAAAQEPHVEKPACEDSTCSVAVPSPGANDGCLDSEFLLHLRREGSAIGGLSSELKIKLYNKHGAAIGKNVYIGQGSFIVAERMVMGDDVRIDDGCHIEARELQFGRLAHMGARCRVKCRKLTLGENAFFAPDVEIGGGGCMDPEAELIVGSHGFVGEHVHLNPCRKLQIGDEVVISRGAVVMTHSFGASVLDGFPNRLAGVRIGDRCQIGISGILFPGVEMGEGSILLSGSSLVTSVPAGRLYGGVPAKDLKSAAAELSPLERESLAREIILEFSRQLQLRGFTVRERSSGVELEWMVVIGKERHRLLFAPVLPAGESELFHEDVRVGMRAATGTWEHLGAEIVGIDLGESRIRGVLGPMALSFREFLRKKGIRLHPRTWTYPGGWL
ncbi:MAG: biotin/lipoyl-containing protein [Planctomycetota bacterium]